MLNSAERTMFRQRMPSNRLICNIVDELITDCVKLEIAVDYNVALLAVNLFSLDPKYGISQDIGVVADRKSTDLLIRKCISLFSVAQSDFVQTLKMQVYFMDHALDANQIIGRHREQLLAKSQPLTRDIINSVVHSKHDDNKYFKKLATDIIVHFSLGNPTKAETMQETITALKSVMSKNDLVEFMALPSKEKMESLNGLRGIVCGIRVFNQDAGHCGDGILDIKEVLQNGYMATKKQLDISSNEIEDRIHLLTSSLNRQCALAMMRHATPDHAVSAASTATRSSRIDVGQLKEALIMNRQHERFINELSGALAELKLHIDRLLKAFREKLNDVHETVKYRIAIPTEKIFPKFIDVAKLWEHLRNQLYVLSEINVVNEQLMALTFSAPEWIGICDVISQMAAAAETQLTSADCTPSATDKTTTFCKPTKSNALNATTAAHSPDDTAAAAADSGLMKIVKYHNDMKIEYGGFCAWTLAEFRGLLLLGDYSSKIIAYKGKNYAFTAGDAMRLFQLQPDRCLQQILDVLCEMPQLIIFFDMYGEMHDRTNTMWPYHFEHRQSASAARQSSTRGKQSIEIQTETHPIPYNKDPKYTYSIWEQRRRVLQLANLLASRTQSTQSDESAFRRNGTSQTYSSNDRTVGMPSKGQIN